MTRLESLRSRERLARGYLIFLVCLVLLSLLVGCQSKAEREEEVCYRETKRKAEMGMFDTARQARRNYNYCIMLGPD
jgi:hypothetical protein